MRRPTTKYQVRGASPVRALNGPIDNYLYVATTLPDYTPSHAEFVTHPLITPAANSLAHKRAHVPISRAGFPDPVTIELSNGFEPTDQELDALHKLAANERIQWSYQPQELRVRVESSIHIIECQTPDGQAIFPGVSAQSIMLAGLRSFAEQRP